jgi:hypothetical protein
MDGPEQDERRAAASRFVVISEVFREGFMR